MDWTIACLLTVLSIRDWAFSSELSVPQRVKVESSVLSWDRPKDYANTTYAVQYNTTASGWRDAYRGTERHFNFTADAEDFYGKTFRVRAERGNRTSAWETSKPVQCAHLHTCAPVMALKVETDRVHLWMKHRDGSLKEKEGRHIEFRLQYWKRNSTKNKQEPYDTSSHVVLEDLESGEEYCFQATYLLFHKPHGKPSPEKCAVIPETSKQRNLRVIMLGVLTTVVLAGLGGCLYFAYKHHKRIKALLQPPLDIPDHFHQMILQRVIIFVLAELIMTCASSNYSAQCKSPQRVHSLRVIQGEGLRLPCPNLECSRVINNSLMVWFKKGSDGIQPITAKENERVYYQGVVLYFLPLSLNDTGLYITQWWHNLLECTEFETEIGVDEKFHPEQLYANLTEQADSPFLECPVWLEKGETITWYKDFHLIPNESGAELKLYLPSEKGKGIYTCVCTWDHHGQHFNTSGSFRVCGKDYSVPFPPTFLHPINNSVAIVDLGTEVKLNCLVFFGIDTWKGRNVYWMRNNNNLDSYTRLENGSMRSSFKISQVSETDLRYNYCCIATSLYKWNFVCITLKTRESLLPVIVTFSCTTLFLLLAAGMVKRFTVDLVLFFRSFKIMQSKKHDGKLYDAYVIYQQDNDGDTTEGKVAYFVNKILTDVLENACGFKLYISGRDDLPGEDCTELIEKRMQLSRRLIAVLPPGVSQSPGVTTPLSYEWHVGLHRVLVEQELRVILIQLGDMNDYSHLSLGLQHLLQKTPPLKWDEGRGRATCPSSCFWKKVRHMMPVPSDSRSRDVNI